MDKINLLKTRRDELIKAGKEIRDCITKLIDEKSFVELSSFSFSKNEFYGVNAEGEGVVTGFATIESNPVYIVAQNFAVLSGGVSLAGCEKMIKCMRTAEKNGTPIIYILNTQGVQLGEGVAVLEGLSKLLVTANSLKGIVPQFCIVNGDVYGQIALLSAICDFSFAIDKKSILGADSPLVISAKSGQTLSKEKVCGVEGLTNTNLFSFQVKSVNEAKSVINKILGLLPDFGDDIIDGADLNASIPTLNKDVTAKDIITKVFDANSVIEIGLCATEVKCVLGRIGGIAVAGVIFEGENGVELDAVKARKLKDFAQFVAYYNLPYITFVNTMGIEANVAVNNSNVLNELADYIEAFGNIDNAKISVVFKKAVGLGYTLFASKSAGFDYSCAFATSKIALFDSSTGAFIEFDKTNVDKAKLAEKYADENSDPVNAARGGYIDDIIEPQYVRQYLISSLQMLIR